MMLSWDHQAVATFLGAQAVLDDNSSYRFTFKMQGCSATLQVFPYNGEIELTIGSTEQPFATWRLNCSVVALNEDIPDEGGPALVFIPANTTDKAEIQSHWVVLGKTKAGIEILTVFQAIDEASTD